MGIVRGFILSLFLVSTNAAFSFDLPDQNGIAFDRFFQFPQIGGRSPGSPAISPNGKTVVFTWNKTGARKRDLWLMDYATGEKKQIAGADDVPRFLNQDDARTEIQKKEQEQYDGGWGGSALWAPDSSEFILNYRGRTLVFSADGSSRKPLVDGQMGISGLEYSRDGKFLYFLDGPNIWRMDRKSNTLKQITYVSKGGTSVSEFEVSPDGKTIAIVWADFTKYQSHIMMDFTKDRSQIQNIQRMWNGNDEALDIQYGLVDSEGGLIKYVDNIPRSHWGADIKWAPDSSAVLISYKSEDHKEFKMVLVDRKTGKDFAIYSEKAPKNYINNWRPFEWTLDSKSILLGTDVYEGKFTRRGIYKMDKNGRGLTPYFVRDYDVAQMQKGSKTDDLFLVTQGRNPLFSEYQIVSPSGQSRTMIVDEKAFNGVADFEAAGNVTMSDSGREIVTVSGTPTSPPEMYKLGDKVEKVTESPLADFKKIEWAKWDTFQFKAADGAMISGTIIYPKNYDPNKRYPTYISNMYANSAKAEWAGYTDNYAAMVLGMVVVKLDFRSSWGYGGEFNSGYYQKMGLIDSEEAVACKNYLVEKGISEKDRMGVWGWSYGGFLACMIQMTQPGQFKTGVAVASVTDWKSYNHWYTRQRLGLVSKDKEVFEKTSPITYADKLQGDLLLVHGMLDDNVLFQDSARLSMKLIDAGKSFSQFYYPRDDHSIGKDETRLHVQKLIMSHLRDQLTK